MPNHYTSIGLPIRNQEEFVSVVRAALHQPTETFPCADFDYIRYGSNDGVELWIEVKKNGSVLGCDPHFVGQGRMRFGVMEVLPAPEHVEDGKLNGWVDPTSKPDFGQYPLVVEVPDFALVRDRLSSPRIVTLQIAAFAHDLECFASNASYEAVFANSRGSQQFSGLAAEACIPTGTFSLDDTAEQPLKSEAIFNGHILAATIVTNPLSQQPFHWILLQTLGGTIDVVADPVLNVAPMVGGVASGSFWLSAHVVDGLSD